MFSIFKKESLIEYSPEILNCNVTGKQFKKILPERTSYYLFNIPVYTTDKEVVFYNDVVYREYDHSLMMFRGKMKQNS
jgi:hypothetical protein